MYEVFGTVKSRAFRVLWALEELGQPYLLREATPHSEPVVALNPTGKLPILRDGDNVLTDSVAITNYLAEKHGALTAKCGSVARAKQDAMTFKIIDEVDAILWANSRNRFILPEDKRVPALEQTLMWEYSRNIMEIMEIAHGCYLMGDSFTVCDIVLTNCGTWAADVGFPTDNEKFRAYVERNVARPAFQQALRGDCANPQ